MPYIIRNAAGQICGRCTGKPGEGNLLPDGSPERVEYIEEDTPEVLAFLEKQAAVIGCAVKRGAAMRALEESSLTLSASDSNSPQAVKDYVAELARMDKG